MGLGFPDPVASWHDAATRQPSAFADFPWLLSPAGDVPCCARFEPGDAALGHTPVYNVPDESRGVFAQYQHRSIMMSVWISSSAPPASAGRRAFPAWVLGSTGEAILLDEDESDHLIAFTRAVAVRPRHRRRGTQIHIGDDRGGAAVKPTQYRRRARPHAGFYKRR